MIDNERIAVLETRMDGVQEIIKDEVMPCLRRIEKKQTRQAGFMAGITFMWTIIVGSILAVWQYLTK